MEKIDLVLTYVDNLDKEWQKEYNAYSKIEKRKYDPNGVRFRNWDNFVYLLRAIDEHMKFINNLFIVVSSEQQVPKWLNRDNVKIVLHKDIIPEKYLPTFNSNTIEMFFYNIKDLSENFLYANDDMFPNNNMTADDFFDKNMNPKIIVKERRTTDKNIYIGTLKNTQLLAVNENPNFKIPSKLFLLRSNHSINPMKKSMWEYYWNKYENRLSKSITRFRSILNITQELSNYHFYMKYKTNNIKCFGERKTQYFSYIKKYSSDLKRLLNDKTITAICINDAKEIDFNIFKKATNKLLAEKYPNKCKYEL